MKQCFIAKSIDELKDVAQNIWKVLYLYPDLKIVLFSGDMGAGKTSLIRNMCDVVDVTDTVTSPTFAIINEYEIPGAELIYHFDFYRINSLTEAYDLGYEEYFYSGNYCFIEWAEKIAPIIDVCAETLKMAKITIDVSNEIREISIEIN